MLTINFPATFLNVEELATRWKCSVHKIQALAEENKLKLFVRPIALEIALEKFTGELPNGALEELIHKPLDCKNIYYLFNNKQSHVQIDANLANFIIHIDAQFCDIVIPISAIETFECCYGNRPGEDLIKILQSDFSYILLNGKEHIFGETQAKIIKSLYIAYESGNPWKYGKCLLAECGAGSERIHSVFKGKNNWQEVILSDHRGRFRLNLPPKKQSQMTLF